jgi:hypothetical protein
MNWMRSFLDVLKRLTGVTARRNRALRYANDWAETVNQFLKTHNLNENINIDKFLENRGNIMFEISVLAHNGRSLIEQIGNLKNKQVALLVAEMVGYVESIRRYLFSPSAQKERLRQVLIKLRTSCESLQKNLAEIKRQ